MHFDPDELEVMGRAYDAAMHKLGNPRVKVPTADREAVAKRIIEIAGAGVLDGNALRDAGLAVLPLTATPLGGLPCTPVAWGPGPARSTPSRQPRPLRYGSRSRRWRI